MELIDQSVGKGGRNVFKDVAVVQHLINGCLHMLTPLSPLEADGKIGPKTVGAIQAFQEKVMSMKKPDGRVDPNGNTLKKLNQHII